jgi:Ni/Fe-hydrogenase subunit HybB-like protein
MSETDVKLEKNWFTPFNMISGLIVVAGIVVTVIRFTKGLSAVTNLSDYNPWGIWIGFDLMVGVALAAGGYVTSSAVYLFGMRKFHSAVRPAILTGFLGYFFVVIALNYDVGRPWRLPYPFINGWGTTSLLFEVGLCVALYLTVLFLEFSPAALEWLGLKKTRELVHRLTIVLTIFGVVLSTLHQSSLGALFLSAPSKLHPLWYSPYLPTYFFVSSVIAGLSMVILEGALSHKAFHHKMSRTYLEEHEPLILGFARAASLVLAGYFTIKMVCLASGNNWRLLTTGYGLWYLFEITVFVLLPCFLYAVGVRDKNLVLIRWTSVIAVLGIIVNRLNVSIIAFNWQLPMGKRYMPSFMEIVITLFMVTMIVICFRFIVTRMPIFDEHPDYQRDNH